MATGAGVRLVNRQFEQRLVHEHGNLFPIRTRFRQRLVAVALEAITVLDGLGFCCY